MARIWQFDGNVSYDDLDRLIGVTYHNTDAEAFVMDDLGNRTGDQTLRADGTVNFAVDSTTNRYTSIAGSPITHDDAGNMTGDKDGYVYFYDYENRIVKIEDDSSSTVATFEYDALGRRIRKVDAVVFTTTLYYYDPDWRCLEERDGSDVLQRSFIYGNYIDEGLVMTVPGSPPTDYYYLHDHLYSAVALLSSGGSVVERYEYDAYGTVHILTSGFSVLSSSQYGNPYTFTGRRLDELDNDNLDVRYYRHRSYDSYVGRFLQHDPLHLQLVTDWTYVAEGLAIDMDAGVLYRYADNNPVWIIDSWGLWGADIHADATAQIAWQEGLCHFRQVGLWDLQVDTGPTAPIEGTINAEINGALSRLLGGLGWGPPSSGVPMWQLNLLARWHFPGADLGQPVSPGSWAARREVEKGLARCNLKMFAKGLHPLQDSYAHQSAPLMPPWRERVGHSRDGYGWYNQAINILLPGNRTRV